MATKVTMPQLGESVLEGTISKWLKKEGDQINEYDPLLEVNTDKVDTEIPSPTSGVVLKIVASEGQTVKVGTILAWIGEPNEVAGEQLSGNGAAKAIAAEPAPVAAPAGMPAEVAAETQPQASGRDRDLGFISPVVARIASERGVDLYKVKGTGQGGRITKKDVLAYLEQAPVAGAAVTPQPEAAEAVAPAPELAAAPGPAPQPARMPAPEILPGEVLPLTNVRRMIAEHMVYSKHTSPHVTTVMEVDMSQVVGHRAANKAAFERDGANLTFTPYFISAIVSALKMYPLVNSSWSDQGIVIHREINVGMATSLGEEGLIVPVIKNADSFSLLGLARAVNDLAKRARAKQLKPDEVKGGTFTLTNHGTSGSLFATPIINQPQCAILGAGVIQKRVVVINDAIAIRPMVYVSLTFDHRILDGASGDYFLAQVVKSLQDWT